MVVLFSQTEDFFLEGKKGITEKLSKGAQGL